MIFMTKTENEKQPIFRRHEHPDKRRYYIVHLWQNLFNEWEVVRCWGDINQATGNKKVVPCDSYQDALECLSVIEKQRRQNKYELVVR